MRVKDGLEDDLCYSTNCVRKEDVISKKKRKEDIILKFIAK